MVFSKSGLSPDCFDKHLCQSLISSLSRLVGHPFVPNLQNIFTYKPLELGTYNIETVLLFTTPSVSGVTCQMCHVMCHVSHVT